MSYIQKRGKNTSWREGLMRNLVTELIIHEKLLVTETRAKELQKHIDKVITLAKRQGELHAIRQAESMLRNIKVNEKQTALQKLFGTIAKRYENRQGGYTELFKTDNRRGDDAPMVYIRLIK